MVYPSLISKSKEFSQSISRVAAGGDTIAGTQISGYGDTLMPSFASVVISNESEGNLMRFQSQILP